MNHYGASPGPEALAILKGSEGVDGVPDPSPGDVAYIRANAREILRWTDEAGGIWADRDRDYVRGYLLQIVGSPQGFRPPRL